MHTGYQLVVVGDTYALGSIPAHAGLPARSSGGPIRRRVYPHACGATSSTWLLWYPPWGLSPRMWGYRGDRRSDLRGARSISVYTGLPQPRWPTARASRVYPRAYGATLTFRVPHGVWTGLSPRMRGHPLRFPMRPGTGRVYPRVCGVTHQTLEDNPSTEGLSPRMRGYREPVRRVAPEGGSIPAYAGLPETAPSVPGGHRVYPRVCGVTAKNDGNELASGGLSPRMRGYLSVTPRTMPIAGSIPAYAGLPGSRLGIGGGFGVYPRVCGVT